jgi:hypothetical protein
MSAYLVPFLLFFASCGTLQKWTIRSNSSLFERSGDRMTREDNWLFFRQAAPGNIKFIELLSLQDPNNMTLLSTLVKSYSGYAFGVHETLAFGDQLAGEDDSPHKREALHYYTRALDYGLDYLHKRGVSRQDLLNLKEDELARKIDKEMRDKDLTAVLYTAQSWGSLIQLQQDNVALVAQVPRVKVMFDWVCGKKPDIDNGVCDIFYAQYEASRPRMLGGNPVRAAELYKQAMEKHPKNLLIRVGYLQYLVLPAFDEEAYEVQAQLLKREFERWGNLDRSELERSPDYRGHEDLNLYNAIAKKRFELIEANKAKIF